MKKISLASSLLPCLLLFFGQADAGTDPVGWSISPTSGFPAQTQTGSTYAVTYTLTNNLPFPVALSVTAAYQGGTFTFTNGCNKTLAAKGQANSSCLVHLGLQPIAARNNTVQITMAYDKNRVPLPTLSSTSTSNETPDKISGHVTSPLPPVTYTGNSYPVEFSFVNNGTSSVTATAVNVSGFTPTNNTCTSALAPHSPPCTVVGTFAPVSTGQATLGVTYDYDGGSVPLTTTTQVHTESGCHVSASIDLPLPANSFIYADNVIKYKFTNHCATSETLGAFSVSSDGSATLTKGTDSCSNHTLTTGGANQSCSVYVSVVPTATKNDLSVTGSIPYQNGANIANASTSEIVNALSSPSTLHTVMLINQCDENVWYEFANGVGGVNSPDPTPKTQRSYFDYQLPQQVRGALPATKVLSFAEYINGNIYGRTQCDYDAGYCQTANCQIQSTSAPYTNWSCQPGKGVTGPATLLEEYMPDRTGQDGVYDVTVINGMNLPAEMKSLAPMSSYAFGCGQAAGAVIQPSGSSLGACSWAPSPPNTGINSSANFIWVTPGADDGCTPSTNCGTNMYCGTAYNSVTAVNGGLPPLNRRCGSFLGYWQVGDFIPYPSGASPSNWGSVDLYANYHLSTTLTNGPDGPYGTIDGSLVNYGDLYTCPVATSNGSLNTGYNKGNFNVCGCVDYTFTASASPCENNNSDWRSIVYPQISWIKEACPTAYTYQFDDTSSSFTCQIAGQKTSYMITYCPAGKKGNPI
jgi:hypothetical protein